MEMVGQTQQNNNVAQIKTLQPVIDNDGDPFVILDSDDDNDGIPDDQDDLPMDSSEWTDTDGDGIEDNSDLDDDNVGTPILQMISLDSSEVDTDGDGW